MVNDEGAMSVKRREQTLLARCEQFAFGGPETPGGGSLDVLYYTPCGRWFRICKNDAFMDLHPWDEWGPNNIFYPEDGVAFWGERLSILNSACSCIYFKHYRFPVPEQLNQPSIGRDLEVAVASADLEESLTRLESSINEKKYSFEDKRILPRDSPLDHAFPRNSFVHVLQHFARSWPDTENLHGVDFSPVRASHRQVGEAFTPTDCESETRRVVSALSPIQREILSTLRQVGVGITAEQLISEMARKGYEHSESSTKNWLTKMCNPKDHPDTLLLNPGKGYRLSLVGERLADYILNNNLNFS